MLGIPTDLFTPLFAVGRVPGWCAHRLEELGGHSRIVRPAFKCILPPQKYLPLADRTPETAVAPRTPRAPVVD